MNKEDSDDDDVVDFVGDDDFFLFYIIQNFLFKICSPSYITITRCTI